MFFYDIALQREKASIINILEKSHNSQRENTGLVVCEQNIGYNDLIILEMGPIQYRYQVTQIVVIYKLDQYA